MSAVMTKDILLKTLQTEREQWDALLAKFSDEQIQYPLTQGEWSIKDIIAHIAICEKWVGSNMRKAFHGEAYAPTEIDNLDMHQRNAYFYEQQRDSPLEEIRLYAQQAFQQLLEAIQELPEEDLLKAHTFDGKLPDYWGVTPLWQVIAGGSYEHYQQHLPTLCNWLTSN